ncbi:hypothetical protein CRUP_035709, partial [Coryphaenoides rupestris]
MHRAGMRRAVRYRGVGSCGNTRLQMLCWDECEAGWRRVVNHRGRKCLPRGQSVPLSQSTCRDYTILWYYDGQANSCAQFWYGGCGGNENCFETEEECKRTCVVSWT